MSQAKWLTWVAFLCSAPAICKAQDLQQWSESQIIELLIRLHIDRPPATR